MNLEKNRKLIRETCKEEFEILAREYMDYNSHTNISAIRDIEEVYPKHFLDSLSILDLFQDLSFGKAIDLGAGGGFPSLPLAIAFQKLGLDIRITALDSTAKKTSFIDSMKSKLSLDNLEILTGRIEDLGQDSNYREKFDSVLARSLANLPTLLEYAIPFLKVDGKLLAYKDTGIADEISSAKNAFEILGAKLEEQISYEIDGNTRQILVISKDEATDTKYPRRTGKPLKSPL